MKKIFVLFTFLLPVLLAGCSFTTGVDTLLSPPKLSKQQEQIFEALKTYTGSNISLKYPKTGKNLSAFIIEDIDGDSDEEAIVFYKKNITKSDDDSLRLNILDKVDNEWLSVYDHSADGNEIEQVEVTKLGDSGKISIIAGFSLINRNEKKLSIYNYSDSKLVSELENEAYSAFNIADLNNDGKNELFTVSVKSGSENASACMYFVDTAGKINTSSLTLSDNYTNYRQILFDKNSDNHTSIYIDAEKGNGNIVTEVLKVGSDSILLDYFTPDPEKNETLRSLSYLSTDIDNDGKTEIPVPHLCSGYDKSSENPVYFTSWYSVDNGRLQHKYESLMSITDGYVFFIPESWYGQITAKSDISKNEIMICSGITSETAEEIFTIKTVTGKESQTTPEDNSFQLLRSRGDKQFFIHINNDSLYVKSTADIMIKFKFDN